MSVMSAAASVGAGQAIRRPRLGRLLPGLAWGTAGLVLVLTGVTCALHVSTGGSDLTSWWAGDVVLAVVLLVPGLLVALRRPDNAIGWLMLTGSLSTAVSGAGREYLVYGFLGGAAPGYLGIGWASDALYLVSMATLPLVLMLFPDGRPISRWAGGWMALPLASMLLGTFGALFAADPDGVDVQGRRLYNPARHVFPAWLSDGAATLSWVLFQLGIVAAVVLLVVRYRRSGAEIRQQMKWVVWAGSIGALELATELIPDNQLSQYTGPAASALLVASVCVAILRHRLFDIDLVINRTLVYLLLSVSVVGLYLAVVALTDVALGEPVELGSGLLATAVVALAFGPVRSRLQQAVDTVLYGERRNPYRVISQLGRRLAEGEDELTVVVQTVSQALKLPYAAILDDDGQLLAETGTPSGTAIRHPLSYHGVPMGELLVSPRRTQAGFDRQERRLLADLARQIGAAVHAVRLSQDLQASRTRLVNAKEEERRRLRRDLHDGLGPKLAALGLKIDAAHALSADRPEASRALMGAVKDDIRTTIDDIRRLVYGLRPAALDELGLAGALREVAGRFDEAAAGGLEITLRAPESLPPLPAAVEVAAYRIVTEALTNTVRHAYARHARVEILLRAEPDELQLAVCDDGIGLPRPCRPGVGTASMRERAEELGGRIAVGSGPDGRGVEVRAQLPCEGRP